MPKLSLLLGFESSEAAGAELGLRTCATFVHA